MGRKIKLIWDFYSADAKKTAEHHAIHLSEFANMKSIKQFKVGSENETDEHHLAYIIVAEENMVLIRDSLRPKRGQWVEDQQE